jgi:hypothetical protein
MKFKKYLNEDYLTEMMKFVTDKDGTGHTHAAQANEDGDGKTTSTSEGEDHVHEILQWMVQPAAGHVHNLGL